MFYKWIQHLAKNNRNTLVIFHSPDGVSFTHLCCINCRVLGHFEKPIFLELCKYMESLVIPANAYLFKTGDPDDSIYVVQAGKVHVFITEPVRCYLSRDYFLLWRNILRYNRNVHYKLSSNLFVFWNFNFVRFSPGTGHREVSVPVTSTRYQVSVPVSIHHHIFSTRYQYQVSVPGSRHHHVFSTRYQ